MCGGILTSRHTNPLPFVRYFRCALWPAWTQPLGALPCTSMPLPPERQRIIATALTSMRTTNPLPWTSPPGPRFHSHASPWASPPTPSLYSSHELRTPLNTAFLGLKILMEDLKAVSEPTDVEKDRLETCGDVHKAVLGAVEILNGILTFDKIEGGLMGLKITDVAVEPMVTECVAGFEKEAERAGVRLALVVPRDDLPPVNDVESMHQQNKAASAAARSLAEQVRALACLDVVCCLTSRHTNPSVYLGRADCGDGGSPAVAPFPTGDAPGPRPRPRPRH